VLIRALAEAIRQKPAKIRRYKEKKGYFGHFLPEIAYLDEE
jgi:hypothetical protein